LDSAVAELYGVETKEVNQAIQTNPDKFPEGYIFELSPSEKREVIENFENLNTDSVRHVVKNFDHIEYTPSMAHSELRNLNTGFLKEVTTNCDNLNYTRSMAYLEKSNARQHCLKHLQRKVCICSPQF
jgi:hypothetical protein